MNEAGRAFVEVMDELLLKDFPKGVIQERAKNLGIFIRAFGVETQEDYQQIAHASLKDEAFQTNH